MIGNKSVIIDEIDVSGCSCHYNGWSQLYRDNRDMCDKGYDLECKPKENGCYHYTKCLEEQLTRKTQECEELKDKIKFMEEYIKTVENARDELERENKFSKEQAEQKLERITNILFTGKCSNCEGYSPNCSNKELCDFKHNIKNIIDEVK